MDAQAQESFRKFVANRSSALLKTAVLLSGGDRHAGEDLLQNALIKAAGRWHRIDEPEAYVRQVLYRQQVSRWRLKWPRRELSVAELPETGIDPDASGAAELRLVMRGAWADGNSLVAWDIGPDGNEYHQRLVLVTIGGGKTVPLSDFRSPKDDTKGRWEPVSSPCGDQGP
ncbi:hypothetical protein ACF08O_16775 [Streptomyces paradoxus]|uniref:hypothetical protein n=1 Tax=Streptomyces paradoxus TaxID=66375 RepID=UPI0036FD468D